MYSSMYLRLSAKMLSLCSNSCEVALRPRQPLLRNYALGVPIWSPHLLASLVRAFELRMPVMELLTNLLAHRRLQTQRGDTRVS